MSEELDPHLANVLRQAPPPPAALDPAHRQAVLAAASQERFRRLARQRRHLFGLAAAAVLAAGIAGWTLRVVTDDRPQAIPPPVVAIADGPAPEALDGGTSSFSAPAEPAPMDWRAEAEADEVPAPAATGLERFHSPESLSEARATAPTRAMPSAAAESAPPVQAKAVERSRRSEAGRDAVAAAADVAAAAASSPAPAPQADGRLVLARLVVDAIHAGRIAPSDRTPTIRVTLDLLRDLEGHEAADLRRRLSQADPGR